jgi:hypothetical protein
MRARLFYDKEPRPPDIDQRASPLRSERCEFSMAMSADACNRDADGLECGPSIDALVDILEREQNSHPPKSD